MVGICTRTDHAAARQPLPLLPHALSKYDTTGRKGHGCRPGKTIARVRVRWPVRRRAVSRRSPRVSRATAAGGTGSIDLPGKDDRHRNAQALDDPCSRPNFVLITAASEQHARSANGDRRGHLPAAVPSAKIADDE